MSDLEAAHASIRGEARFTRDVDQAFIADTDADAERIVYSLRDAGYTAIALVEHRDRPRLAPARLALPSEVIIDLIVATCGIACEVVERAIPIRIQDVGEIPIARAEELLAFDDVRGTSESEPCQGVSAKQ